MNIFDLINQDIHSTPPGYPRKSYRAIFIWRKEQTRTANVDRTSKELLWIYPI